MKILLTSTSFQDTPGIHQKKLKETGFEIATLRGPVSEDVLLPIVGDFDGIICGDDAITKKVIDTGKQGKLKIISKYGVGLDKIDLEAAKKNGIPVTNCPGVNHVTVAEHVMALLLTFYKNVHLEYNITKKGEWKRLIGNELCGKKLGIIGFGKIGKELFLRAVAFQMDVTIYDPFYDKLFKEQNKVKVSSSLGDLFINSDVISLNLPLNESTKGMINKDLLNKANNDLVLINTSRALIIDLEALLETLKNKKIRAYLTDVMDVEPMIPGHDLLLYDNVIITPHIGSRTYESVQRQGLMAVENLVNELHKYSENG